MNRPLQIDEIKLEADFTVTRTIGAEAIKLIRQLQTNINNCQDEKEKIHRLKVAEHAFKNLGILAIYFQTVFTNGLPKELVFINHKGNKIDLVQNKDLDDNELANLFFNEPKDE